MRPKPNLLAPSKEGWTDSRLVRLAGRVEVLLFLLLPVLVWQAWASWRTPWFLLYAPFATSLTLLLLLTRLGHFRGPRLVLKGLAAFFGLLFLVGGIGILAVAVWVVAATGGGPQGFGILMLLAAIPIGIGMGAMGLSLLSAALRSPLGPSRFDLDPHQAGGTDAVRRFDETYREKARRRARSSVPPPPPPDPPPPSS